MAIPRKRQISLADTPYYHCISRYVRRSFLCGEDALTQKNFEHRRVLIEEQLLSLTSIFAIDIAAYAIMSNHYHVIFCIDADKAKHWSTYEVLSRWHKLYKGTLLTQQYCKGEKLSEPLLALVQAKAEIYRKRLIKISWLLGYVNQNIAIIANAEDNCTGSFWEGRYKLQPLLDEKALAACMAYVDLNPVRAKMAKTPEGSDHTSIQLRIEHAKKNEQPKSLQPFIGNPKLKMPQGIPFELLDYIQLVELTGRCIRKDKTGYIEANIPDILQRLNIQPENWLMLTKQFHSVFHGAVGHEQAINDYCEHQHFKRRSNVKSCKTLLG
jgi:hypothetical protein